MSSEWWSILAVFWGLYLADGLRGGRRARFHIHGWKYSRSPAAHATPAAWFFIPPVPSAWALTARDLPASLAPEGITNWPSVSASRPPPLPDQVVTWRWEDIQRVEDHAGHLHVNGRRFTFSTPGLTAPALATLARELAPLCHADRVTRLYHWHTARFSFQRLNRRLRLVLVRSRCLAFLNTLQVVLLAVATAYLLLDGPARIDSSLADALARQLPVFLAAYAGLHLIALTWFYRLHRRLFPRAGQERASVIFTALLVPPQALRLHLHPTTQPNDGIHPLATAMTVMPPSRLRALATDTLRDLRWPRHPASLPEDAAAILRESSNLIEPVLLSSLNRSCPALTSDLLLAAPAPESPYACAYCPRCGDQFTRAGASCAHGIPLRPLAKSPQTGDT
jgi:hypothetical protein